MGEETNGQGAQLRQHFGSREHATETTRGRHPGVQDALQWLTFSHLPPDLRPYSQPFYSAACDLLDSIPAGGDSPELTSALNGLIKAKDAAVRAGIKYRYGRAGSVSRPQTVVDPPLLSGSSKPFADAVKCRPGCALAAPHHGDCKVF